LGNQSGGLPFTVMVDATGGVEHRHLGVVTKAKLEEELHHLVGRR
jgi:hypothetical protein